MKKKTFTVGIRKTGISQKSLRTRLRALTDASAVCFTPETTLPEQLAPDVLLAKFTTSQQEFPLILQQILTSGFELCYLSFGAATTESTQIRETHSDQFEKAVEQVSLLQHELLELILRKQAGRRKINLPSIKGFRCFDLSSIVRCESEDNYTHVYFTDHKKVLVSRTLQEFEQQLSDAGFLRVHHKHLINTEHIVEYQKGKGGQLIMSDNSTIDVSVRRKADFMRYMNESGKMVHTY